MKNYNLKNFIRGWIIGFFQPSLFKTKNFEIAIKEYKSGEKEKTHYHRIAKEFTVIVSGKVKMNGNIFSKGDIIEIGQLEDCEFESIEDSITCVIKIPSVKNDKFEKE